MLAITGEAGIGKSTVWEEAVRSAERRGALVLVSRPAEAEAKLSFAGLSDLVEGVDASVFESLPAPQRDALDLALLRVDRGSRTPQQRTVATALLSLLRTLSVEREVVLAIDDWQWLDPPTRHAVSFAMRRVVDEWVRLVVAVRSGGGVDPAELGAAPDRIAHVRLGALSVASLHGILAERLGDDVLAADARPDRAGRGRQPVLRARDRARARRRRHRVVRRVRRPARARRRPRSRAACRDPRRVAPGRGDGAAGAAARRRRGARSRRGGRGPSHR